MATQEVVMLERDTMASMVPSGARIMLHAGTEVIIVQDRGGSYTVNVYGNLARIEAVDADALGKEPHDPLEDLPDDATLEDKIWTQLKTCYDPEIPVNIVELGLIYNQRITPLENDTFHVEVVMTLTAPGCGMGDVIAGEARDKVLAIPEVATAEVSMTFEPPWDKSMMSEAAQLATGMM